MHQFLSESEIEESLAQLNALGWRGAPVRFAAGTRSSPELRNSERVEFTDPERAARLWERLVSRLGAVELAKIADSDTLPIGLRPWFRGYRYQPGQRFGKHRDAVERDGSHITRITALFYLSDATSENGGATILYPSAGSKAPAERVLPQRGSLLLFHSSQLHEGETPRAGNKIVLRSDVLFLCDPCE